MGIKLFWGDIKIIFNCREELIWICMLIGVVFCIENDCFICMKMYIGIWLYLCLGFIES